MLTLFNCFAVLDMCAVSMYCHPLDSSSIVPMGCLHYSPSIMQLAADKSHIIPPNCELNGLSREHSLPASNSVIYSHDNDGDDVNDAFIYDVADVGVIEDKSFNCLKELPLYPPRATAAHALPLPLPPPQGRPAAGVGVVGVVGGTVAIDSTAQAMTTAPTTTTVAAAATTTSSKVTTAKSTTTSTSTHLSKSSNGLEVKIEPYHVPPIIIKQEPPSTPSPTLADLPSSQTRWSALGTITNSQELGHQKTGATGVADMKVLLRRHWTQAQTQQNSRESSGNNNNNIENNPNFSTMAIDDLYQVAASYGLKRDTRERMVALLEHIWQRLHPTR